MPEAPASGPASIRKPATSGRPRARRPRARDEPLDALEPGRRDARPACAPPHDRSASEVSEPVAEVVSCDGARDTHREGRAEGEVSLADEVARHDQHHLLGDREAKIPQNDHGGEGDIPPVEIQTTNYREIVGWETQKWQGPMDYTLWTVDEISIGGVTTLSDDARQMGTPPHWLPYVAVADTDATVMLAEGLGARVHVPPMDIPLPDALRTPGGGAHQCGTLLRIQASSVEGRSGGGRRAGLMVMPGHDFLVNLLPFHREGLRQEAGRARPPRRAERGRPARDPGGEPGSKWSGHPCRRTRPGCRTRCPLAPGPRRRAPR